MKRMTGDQIEQLREFDTPTIWNALAGFKRRPNSEGFSYPGLSLRTGNQKPMIGYAVTAKVSGWKKPTTEQKEMMFTFFCDVREMDGPTVAVIQDIDEHPIGSFWGEVQATTFKALGAVGTITAGGVRDINEVSAMGFYFFSTEIMVARADSHLVDRNSPVKICDLTIHPGDLIHADGHGATIIPADIEPQQLADACRRVLDAESLVIEPCRKAIQAGKKPTIDQLRNWRNEMSKKR